MSHWQKIREAARHLRRDIYAADNLDEKQMCAAAELLERAAEHLELDLIPEHPDSINLSKALAVLENDCVYFNNHLKNWYKNFCIAYEIGHFVVHREGVHCTREEIESFAADGEAGGGGAIEKLLGYGAGMRREREANLFALELLLPCDALKKAFLEEKLTPPEMAEKVGLPPELVCRQLARALLIPSAEIAETKDENAAGKIELDASQHRAAEEAVCPTLVAAGPGTGKTQTLTGRIEFLLSRGFEAKRILTLTFSNKAAEEMRERIGRVNPPAAAQIQVMTFHAYGLDILRTYYREAGLETHSNLLDKIDALLHLEKNLNILNLNHYQLLHDPTANLTAMLGAISRAKDELCAPAEYKILGEKMFIKAQTASDHEATINAEKVLETARVYEFYEKFLEDEKLLDFGDLIFRAVKLLRENEAVKREVAGKYDAILVDEFQDVNRACGMLLKEIAGDGKKLWAVGDLRQSIYRWRGASPANINLFGADFPNAETISLAANYRSHAEIINLFSRFAGTMKAAGADFFSDWEAVRGDGSSQGKTSINFEIADSLDAEAVQIAEHIKNHHKRGLRYKDCTVICRTHKQLAGFAEILTKQGIPIFYLGQLFERGEVRDLLALLDLRFSLDGHSLIRVANFGEYEISLGDARKIITRQKENKQTLAEVLSDENFIGELSKAGRTGAAKLAGHLTASPENSSAWSFLSDYLFTNSTFLSGFFADDNIQNQSRRLGIYQFLRLAQSVEERFSGEAQPIAEFLKYVVKLAYFNEDKNYAQMPTEAENLDAVRLLTVHSAKGLEFPAVFLPFLGAGKIPGNRQTHTCPNPDGMIAGEKDFHDDEEECLFFVAMSRARDHLHLSRATVYGASNSNESKFLTALKDFLPPARQIETKTLNDEMQISDAETETRHVFYSRELDTYLDCPRRYYYANILGLKGAHQKPIYLKFHSCIYDTLQSIQTMRQMQSIELSEEAALARLDEFWQAAEVDAHPYAPIYKERANEIVKNMYRRILNTKPEVISPTFEVKLSNGSVSVRLDSLEIVESETGEKTALIRKYKTGKEPKEVKAENAEILMTVAVRENFPDAVPSLQRFYLSDDAVADVSVTKKLITNRLAKYEQAIDGIRRKNFQPLPEKNECPQCAHFFICSSDDPNV